MQEEPKERNDGEEEQHISYSRAMLISFEPSDEDLADCDRFVFKSKKKAKRFFRLIAENEALELYLVHRKGKRVWIRVAIFDRFDDGFITAARLALGGEERGDGEEKRDCE